MMIAAILGASFVVLLSAFAVSNPWLFGLDTGVDLSNIGVFNQHYMLDGELKMVKEDIGADFEAYRNHCLRVLTFTQFFIPPSVFEVYPNAMNIVAMALAGFWVEGTDVGAPQGWSQWWPILYNAFGVFAFCQVAWFSLAKSLPPVVSSLSIMIIPVVGVMSGSFFLGEVPHWPDFVALVLILGAMAVILVPGRR